MWGAEIVAPCPALKLHHSQIKAPSHTWKQEYMHIHVFTLLRIWEGTLHSGIKLAMNFMSYKDNMIHISGYERKENLVRMGINTPIIWGASSYGWPPAGTKSLRSILDIAAAASGDVSIPWTATQNCELKICGPNSVICLNQRLYLSCGRVRCKSKNRHENDIMCLFNKREWTMCSKIVNILGADLCDLMARSEWTLIIHNNCRLAPKFSGTDPGFTYICGRTKLTTSWIRVI